MEWSISASALTLGLQANIGSKPLYELAELHKDDLVVMLACCKKESDLYWRHPSGARFSPAPYYFERAAILCRKAKEYEIEVEVCQHWKAIMADYKSQSVVREGLSVKTHLGLRSKAILARLPKAKELLKKSRI